MSEKDCISISTQNMPCLVEHYMSFQREGILKIILEVSSSHGRESLSSRIRWQMCAKVLL
jgi:hypothetical protein